MQRSSTLNHINIRKKSSYVWFYAGLFNSYFSFMRFDEFTDYY